MPIDETKPSNSPTTELTAEDRRRLKFIDLLERNGWNLPGVEDATAQNPYITSPTFRLKMPSGTDITLGWWGMFVIDDKEPMSDVVGYVSVKASTKDDLVSKLKAISDELERLQP